LYQRGNRGLCAIQDPVFLFLRRIGIVRAEMGMQSETRTEVREWSATKDLTDGMLCDVPHIERVGSVTCCFTCQHSCGPLRGITRSVFLAVAAEKQARGLHDRGFGQKPNGDSVLQDRDPLAI
jgi:hypothetical protein